MTRTLALALILLAACSNPSGRPAASPADPERPGDPAPATPRVTGALTVTDGQGGAGPFRIGAVSTLTLAGSCASAPPGKHTLRFDVLSPNGAVYASLPQEVVVPESGTASVQSTLPLRGTTVERLMRTGTWN